MSEAVEMQAAAAQKRMSGGQNRSSRQGHTKLSEAADQELVQKGPEIARSLADHAAKGSVQSARLLLELAESGEGEGKESQSGPSLAEQWGAEAEWKEEGMAE